jgi:hypothetical protein
MLDDTEAVEKPTLTPRPKIEPTPICTLMSDGSLKFLNDAPMNPIDLQRMLLSAAAVITARIAQHAALATNTLAAIRQDFQLNEETEHAIQNVLGR